MNIKLLVKKMDELVDSSDIKIINDIDNISLNCISDQKNTLSIMEYGKNIMCPKNSNILFLKAEDEIIENENANIIYSKEDDIFKVYEIVNGFLREHSEFYNRIYNTISNREAVNNLLLIIKDYFDVNVCLLNSNKKLLLNTFDFSTIKKIYPLEIKKKSLSKLYGYLAFETIEDEYEFEFRKISKIISTYIYNNVNGLINSKEDIYSTIKNLISGNITEKDEENIANIGWKTDDNYDINVIKIEGGLFKYQDMFSHGNRFVLDYPMYMYSVLQEGYLVLLTNNKIKDVSSVKTNLNFFTEKYDLKSIKLSLKNNLFNLKKAYDLSRRILENNIELTENLNDNCCKIIYDLVCLDSEIEILVPEFIYKLKYDDINNGTDLLRTLYFYLVEERSLIKASQRLNVHRNSIVYRINKINELVDINLDCYKARKNIISALEIIDRLDNTLKITEEDI
ncbi:PucR family transcriptional regulator [Finegoldia magna]|uniref:Helix-turn-helix domain-containing protein n=1 Tax=Finegoldia magna TaxID=1260 RepID=A0A233VJ25_FINMA|nr:helix-turn-helix domain-containing protein [Finegoldia magna]MBS5964084.1 helix-turn-helix domain-containing protein [Finegoldia magna]MDU1400152.1 helix-turn-helix domain-containing protein [Finegoldia magna]MDU5368493.1 helix-turn-helix domain-containing protein [Finegoldia magna]MDU5444286.1 helix-turn-helix domain-containing protein [Finegoldia magna]MDU7384274.1 helix-turn-helix domain-containing protein [Finegoldia magna]